MKPIDKSFAIQTINDIAIALEDKPIALNYVGYGVGKLSISLFYAYYAKFTHNDRYLELAIKNYEDAIGNININKYDDFKIFFFKELIEIGLFIHFVRKNNLLEIKEIDGFLLTLDNIITKFLKQKIKEGELHHFGGLLAGEYFLERLEQAPHRKKNIEDLIVAFENCAVETQNGYSWRWNFIKNDGVYLGMICGSAKILSFLSAAFERKILSEKCHQLVGKATDFVLSNRRESATGHFPTKIEDSNETTFLLDGDLASCYGLWRAYQTTQRDEIREIVASTLKDTTTRRHENDTYIADASILYGAIGAAFRYEKLFQNTGYGILSETANYWYETALKYRIHSNDTAGFKARFNQTKVQTNITFDEGIVGIGIGLMRYVDKKLPIPSTLIGLI